MTSLYRHLCRLSLAVTLACCATNLAAQDKETPINFEDHVAAIFKKSCATCHGDGKQEAGLSLATYADVMKGSGGGKVVVAGRSSASRLIEVLTSTEIGEQMPPDGDRLTDETIKLLTVYTYSLAGGQ